MHYQLGTRPLKNKYDGPIETINYEFEYHVVDHCNLNCTGCFHCAPLAEPNFRTPEAFEKDCKNLFRIAKHGNIQLLGGEPLLHPQLLEFCKIAVKYFDTVTIITNGVLLHKMPQEFFDTINDLKVILRLSEYPFPGHEIAHSIWDKKAKYKQYFNIPNMANKIWNLKGNYNLDDILYGSCHSGDGNTVMDLRDGYLYKCGHQCYSDNLFKYFKIDYPEGYSRDDDRLNLETMTEEEFKYFTTHAVSFCRYCAFSAGEADGVPWHQSERKISEWVLDK